MTPDDRLAEALARLCFIPCPCCDGEMECHAECTFAEDCPEESFTQKSARSALSAYRSAPVDIERCAAALAQRNTPRGYDGWESYRVAYPESADDWRKDARAVLREAGVIE